MQLFLACLSSLQEARILTDVDKARLFSNVVDIHAANVHFWEEYLAPLVAATRDSRQPLNPRHLLDGFLKVSPATRRALQVALRTPSARYDDQPAPGTARPKARPGGPVRQPEPRLQNLLTTKS